MLNENRLFFVGRTISSKLGDAITSNIKKLKKNDRKTDKKHIDEKNLHNNVR